MALPGETGVTPQGPLVVTEPGRYALLCLIPTGADPAVYETLLAATEPPSGPPPQVDGGPPHVANGMFAELVVE